MRVTNIADACILIECAGLRVLTDPWIGTPTYGCWLQYPPPTIRAQDIGRLDYIYISHLHEDHCDFPTIEALDANARIVIMERKPNLLRNHLLANGISKDRIVAVPARQPFDLGGGFHIDLIEPNPAHEYSRLVDSAAVFHHGAHSVYFANDSEPYADSDQYIAQRYRIDIAMLPFAGGSGYPACYDNLSDESKRAEVKRIQRAYLESAGRSMTTIRPRYAAPVATWHVLSAWAAELNPVMSWLEDMTSVQAYFEELAPQAPELLLFGPGQGWDLAENRRFGGDYVSLTAEDRMRFARGQLRDQKPLHEALPRTAAIHVDRLFKHACADFTKKAPYRFPEGFHYLFDCDDGNCYALEAQSGKVAVEPSSGAPTPPYLKVSMDRRLFTLLLIGAASWNIEDVSGLLRYERVPNVYHPEVHTALNFVRI